MGITDHGLKVQHGQGTCPLFQAVEDLKRHVRELEEQVKALRSRVFDLGSRGAVYGGNP